MAAPGQLQAQGLEHPAQLAPAGQHAAKPLRRRAKGDGLGLLGVQARQFSRQQASGFLIAEGIHQAQLESLGPGKDPAIGKAPNRGLVQPAAGGHGFHKLAIARIDQALQQIALRPTQGPIRREDVLEQAAFDRFKAHANPLQQLGEVVAAQDHPNRTGNGAGIGHDFVGGHPQIHPAGGRDVAKTGHHLAALLLQPQQGAMDFLAVAHGAAGAVDPQQQGGTFPVLNLFDRLEHPGAGGAANRPLNGDARHGSSGFAAPGPEHCGREKCLDLKKKAPSGPAASFF